VNVGNNADRRAKCDGDCYRSTGVLFASLNEEKNCVFVQKTSFTFVVTELKCFVPYALNTHFDFLWIYCITCYTTSYSRPIQVHSKSK